MCQQEEFSLIKQRRRWDDTQITELLRLHDSVPQTGAQLMRASSPRDAEGRVLTFVFTA